MVIHKEGSYHTAVKRITDVSMRHNIFKLETAGYNFEKSLLCHTSQVWPRDTGSCKEMALTLLLQVWVQFTPPPSEYLPADFGIFYASLR